MKQLSIDLLNYMLMILLYHSLSLPNLVMILMQKVNNNWISL
jgi:hypothetical protein